MGCGLTFFDHLSNCNNSIRVNALLEPATPYVWCIKDKFNKEYTGNSISNADGFIDILLSDLPDGFFTPFSGSFSLSILDGDCRKKDFKMASFYDEIHFNITGGTRVKDALGCDFDCNVSGNDGGASAIFTFEDISEVNIPWTSLLRGIYGNTPAIDVYFLVSADVYQKQEGLAIQLVGGIYNLTEINIDNGGPATGYVLIHE